jgi:hypothetical protein
MHQRRLITTCTLLFVIRERNYVKTQEISNRCIVTLSKYVCNIFFMNSVSLLIKEMLMLHRFNHNAFAVSVLLSKRLDFSRELAVMTCYVGSAVMQFFYKL